MASLSPLGDSAESIWENYQNEAHFIINKAFSSTESFVSELPSKLKKEIQDLKTSDAKYKNLDNSVLYAIHSSRKAIENAGWKKHDSFGVNIGSSRGATQLFENHYTNFLKNKKSKPLSSPTTTLGNISSWVAHDLQTNGPEISHSITCSTSLHALLNGIAWINSGICDKFLVGGSEAPLTDFTIAQMQALKIYAKKHQDFPCRALDLKKSQNTMVLGEGSTMLCLEKNSQNSLARIIGYGFATEILEHNVSLSTNADCFQRSIKMAMANIDPSEIDVIVTHTPGTIKGDQSEFNAIEKVFCNNLPKLTTNKWKIGHSLGTSGLSSVEMAILMLKHQKFINVPYLEQHSGSALNTIMVNAVGFGGNAVSIVLSK